MESSILPSRITVPMSPVGPFFPTRDRNTPKTETTACCFLSDHNRHSATGYHFRDRGASCLLPSGCEVEAGPADILSITPARFRLGPQVD
ncbi:MAG: hypothetical protein F4073_01775, partial [Rhodobacteraceae bacterium]|nr:hypothetical protein [Paracoccaceae bacterium]